MRCSSLEYQLHVGCRQMPVLRAGRHIQTGRVMRLVTIGTFQGIQSLAIHAAFHTLRMQVIVVPIQWYIARGMTIHTPGRHQYFIYLPERILTRDAVGRCMGFNSRPRFQVVIVGERERGGCYDRYYAYGAYGNSQVHK